MTTLHAAVLTRYSDPMRYVQLVQRRCGLCAQPMVLRRWVWLCPGCDVPTHDGLQRVPATWQERVGDAR